MINKKKFFLTLTVLITIIAVILLTGCGTTTKEVTDNDSDDDVVIAEITTSLNKDDMVLVDNTYPEIDFISCTDFDVSEPNALIEVFKGYPYTADKLVATTNATDRGVFSVDIGNNDNVDNQIFYVTATAPGKRRSEAVILTK